MRGRLRVLPILASVVAAAALTFGTTQVAQAAVVSDPITNVTVTPADPAQYSQLTTTIDFCVPNGTQKGDTFTLTLSQYLTDLPTGFSLNDPRTNAVVATAALSETTPAVITFTMTSYAATHLDTCGTAFVKSNFNNSEVPAGTTVPFTSTTEFGKSFTSQVTPTGVIGNRANPNKYGIFTRSDEGRTNATDFLTYHIKTADGPFNSSVFTDVVPAGEKWTFDCATLRFANVATDASYNYASQTPVTPISQNCTPTSFTVYWGPQADLHHFEALISVSLPAATGPAAEPATFKNLANITTVVGTVSSNYAASASNVQSAAGGSGSGTAVPVSPAPSVSPSPSASPAPSAFPPPQTSPAASATPIAEAATNSGSVDTELAYTGTNLAPAAGIAAGVVILGAALVLIDSRRRRFS
ncbi:Ig-like domain-containing protein [Frondihabitans sp. VKM Ac-2883]|uniref:Ig-like domain-containing protein n=1 Tax=Frondihabitans sp. VKM Ac-2883 TaxID=2783823 RepID=UPI00188AE000|nr:hypothetical protein [Frondihabitans sp. VKM Ac-2883]